MPQLLRLVPPTFGRYIEPFFGGGALFFALRPSVALVSDKNEELMACYQSLRDDYRSVAAALREMPRDEAAYYRIRGSVPDSAAERAARVLYLTTLAFNGIHRVNRAGQFNVPYGGRAYSNFGSEDQLRLYGDALQPAVITAGDFADVLRVACAGDFVYLDPPYTVAHSNNGFLKYNDRIFSWPDQQRLAEVASDLARRGCAVIVSNSYHASIRELYPEFRALVMSRTSVMAADVSRRGPTSEYLFTNLG